MPLPTLRRLARPTVYAFASLALAGCSKSAPASGTEGAGSAAPTPAAAGEAPSIPGLAFLEGFEGEIDAQFSKTAPGAPASPPTPIAALLKSGKFRFDIPEKLAQSEEGARFLGPKAYAIFDSGAKKLSVVSDTKKQVIVIDMNKSGERFKNMGHHGPPGAPGAPAQPEKKITKTGKFETVAGRKCEDWDVTGDHREATICVAHEGISWFSLPAAALPTEHAWALELMDGKHFPLKFIGYDKDGTTEDSRFEITKMDKKSEPDSAFAYPPDYHVMDLDQLFQSFGGMPGGMAGGMNAPMAAGGAGAPGTAPPSMGGMPPGMPSNIPGFSPQQMQQIQQRIQAAQHAAH
jgi:Domain of unknown function (DUF4412)